MRMRMMSDDDGEDQDEDEDDAGKEPRAVFSTLLAVYLLGSIVEERRP